MDYSIDYIVSGLFGGAMVFAIILGIMFLALIIVGIIASWKLFEKVGKKGWYSIIPIYSYWVLTEIAGLNWWWFLLMILDVVIKFEVEEFTFAISICSFLASFNCYYNIAKKFNKDNTFSVFAGIFNFIFMLILGLSKKEVYDNNIPVSKNGIFGHPEENNNMSNNMCEQNNDTIVDEEKSNNEKVSYCGNCGTKLNSNVRFCPNCGKEK